MNNELAELNETLLEKSGLLSEHLTNSILNTLNGLSKKEMKDMLSEVDSKMMLNRLFTSSFSRNELEVCFVIKEIFDERQLVPAI